MLLITTTFLVLSVAGGLAVFSGPASTHTWLLDAAFILSVIGFLVSAVRLLTKRAHISAHGTAIHRMYRKDEP